MKLKLILPTALASMLAACAVVPPKPGTDAYQKMLEDQARENFYALKAREHPSRPAPVVAQTEPPPKVHLKPFNPFSTATATAAPAPTPKPVALSKPAPTPAPAPTPKRVALSKPIPAATPAPPVKPGVAMKPPAPKPVAAATPRPSTKPIAVAKPVPTPKPVPPTKPVAAAKPAPTPKPVPPAKPVAAARPAPTPKPSKPVAFSNPFARTEKARPSDETVYLYDMPHGPEPNSPRYRAYKIQYAHQLAKRPEDLTPQEREWVRRHYRD